jgi:hypothetical protein
MSSIPEAGRGLFAKRDFAVGELVTVSPVAVLNKTIVDSWGQRSVFQNYCLWDGEAELVLFPFTKASMINHQPAEDANLEIRWFSWLKSDNVSSTQWKIAQMDVQALLQSHVLPVDIAYYATQPIAAGDELFVDFGMSWEHAWLEARCHVHDDSGCDSIGQFRSYLYVPTGLFPQTWKKKQS